MMIQQLLANSLAIVNTAPDHEIVVAVRHVGVAIFAAAAVLAVFIYPLTFGPPAPHQNYDLLLLLLSLALTAVVHLLPAVSTARFSEGSAEPHTADPTERLALICTRLC